MMLAGIVLAVLGAGAAVFFFWITPRWIDTIDLGPGAVPLSHFAMNIGASDLLDPLTAASRLSVYLEELIALGYSREIRIILPPDHGPTIYAEWWPVIRAKGFKVLVILGQEQRDSADIADQAVAWATQVLPLIRDDLLGVQIVNEQAYFFAPNEYIAWHRRLAPLVRSLLPGVPIIAGDAEGRPGGTNGLDTWERLVRGGFTSPGDYDIVSLHLTGRSGEGQLKAMVTQLRSLHGSSMRYWVTESDPGHLPWLNAHGLIVDKVFIFGWNSSEYTRRPGGVLV